MKRNLSSWRLVLWLVALFLVILGAKLWVIQLYGSWLPVWDQWDEANRFFRPWREGGLTWHDWLGPHNEHRIFFTRLLDFLLIRLNGRWDTLLQMTINAVLHAGYACALAYCLWNFLGRKSHGLICLLVAPFFALPFAAENVIRGFDSQQYFVIIGSLATLLGLGFASPGSRWWWLGLLAAILNLFTMASGLLAPLAVAGLMGLRAFKLKKLTWASGTTLVTCLAVFALGLALSVSLPADRPSQARSLADFTAVLARNLGWPFLDQPAMIVIVCLPLVLLLVLYFRPEFSERRAAEFLLGFGLWGLLQSAALAYGRANYNDPQGSRYLDALCIVSMASVFGLVLLSKRFAPVRFPAWTAWLLPLAFAGLIFFGIWQLSRQTVDFFLASVRVDDLIEEESVRAFAATDDACWLQDKLVPLPNPPLTIAMLRDPNLSVIMPPLCRAPGASANTNDGWLSAVTQAVRRRAMGVLLAGLALFICTSVMDATGRQGNFPERRFGGVVCLLTGLLVFVWVWPNRNLDPAGQDRDLHRILAFHFMACGDYKQAALQWTAVLRLRAESPETGVDPYPSSGFLRPSQLARQSITRVAAGSDSNLVGWLNENLKVAEARPQ
jgi:hypothetical protein